MPIRVLVVEPHPTVRAGIRALLALFPGVELAGEVADPGTVLDSLHRQPVDVVLLDISRPCADSLLVARRIRKEFSKVRVVVLSLDSHPHYVQQALRAGVAGYLLKNLADELEPALRAVADGKTYFSQAITGPAPSVARETVAPLLTPRQEEVLKLIAMGYSTKEIAGQLQISVKTAQTHRTELMQRLDLHDVAGIVRYAIRTGLVHPD